MAQPKSAGMEGSACRNPKSNFLPIPGTFSEEAWSMELIRIIGPWPHPGVQDIYIDE